MSTKVLQDKWYKAQNISLRAPLQVLPAGELNGMIPELIYSERSMMIAWPFFVHVILLTTTQLQTKYRYKATKYSTN